MPILDHISHSQIEMWQRCPKQWEYRYVHGLKIPPSGALIEGRCYHKALEENFKQKVTSQLDLPIDDCVDAFSTEWDAVLSVEDLINWESLGPGIVKDEGIGLVRAYMRKTSPTIQPLKVEEWYISEVAGVKFLLRMDLIDEDEVVIDHKTSSKKYTQADVDRSLQASASAFALDKAIRFQNHIAIKAAAPDIQVVSTVRGIADIEWWVDMVARIIVQMKTGVAPPRPVDAFGKAGWWCSARFCGYYSMCRGSLEKRTFL